VIAQQDLTRLLLSENDVQQKTAGDVLRLDFVKTLHPDMTLDEAQAYFVQFEGERLPVVTRDEPQRLLGVVYKSALLEKYSAIKKSLDANEDALLQAPVKERSH
jgi:CIC family chloride channel protein